MSPHIRELLNKMTLEEKASLCSGADYCHTTALKKLNINSIMMCDGSHGLVKRIINTNDHAGITESVLSTCFPTASAMAASWNPPLVKKIGMAIAEECREEGVNILLGPAVDIKRSPLCGRNYEYFSEDPYLTAEMAVSFIQGVQSRGVGTCLKYFPVHSQEYRHMTIDNIIDRRALREVYLFAFEQAVKRAKPWCLMSAHHKINGTYASEHKELLTDILRKEWGFDGIVMTDRGAVNDIVSGIFAGLNLEMPSSGSVNPVKIVRAVKEGKLPIEKLDDAAAEIIALISKVNEKKSIIYMHSLYANHQLAKTAAQECIVLLKNKDKILPLHHGEKIAVIGEMAKRPRYQTAGDSSVNPTILTNAFQELSKFTDEITYARGYDIDSDEPNGNLETKAMIAAYEADKVIIFAGLPDRYERNGFDRKDLDIPRNQNELIKKIINTNENVVVILSNGSPVAMPWINKVKAVVEGYLTGQAGSAAMAEILFGKISPSGKLAETFPITIEDTPCYNYFSGGPKIVEYRESIYVGYRYYQKAHKDILFPFGYGLSYTAFTYSDLTFSTKIINGSPEIAVSLNVKNTGDFPGKEIVQIYVRDTKPRIFKPLMELKGFAKVDLEIGETKNIEIKLNNQSFSFFDADELAWKTCSGEYEILVGASSEDIRLHGKVAVRAENDFSPLITEKDIPSYYQLANNKLSIPALEFKILYGKNLPDNEKDMCGNFNLESILGDVKKTFAGRLLYSYVQKHYQRHQETKNEKSSQKKTNTLKKSDKKDTSLLMMKGMIDEIPIKQLVILSGGKFDYEMADGILMMINKEKGGLKRFMKSYKSRRKKNKKRS